MASRPTIVYLEEQIIAANDKVRMAIGTVTNEIARNNGLKPENRDYWKTLEANANELIKNLSILVSRIEFM